jgi:hypothetical protein
MTNWRGLSQGSAAVRDLDPANDRCGSKRKSAFLGLMSALAGCGHTKDAGMK